MRNKLLMTAAAVFILSAAGSAASVAFAAPSPDQMRKAGEVKDPARADAAIAKAEAKDAKKLAHVAHKKAKLAKHKAKAAADKVPESDKPAAG